MRRARAWLVVGVLLLLGGTAALFVGETWPGASSATRGVEPAVAAVAAPPALSGVAPRTPPGPGDGPAAAAEPSSGAIEPVRVRGRVRGPDGLVTAAFVHARSNDGVTTRGWVDVRGEFELSYVPLGDGESVVDLVVVAPGWPPVDRTVVVRPGADVEVELALVDPAEVLGGSLPVVRVRIVDPRGQPLAHLPFVVLADLDDETLEASWASLEEALEALVYDGDFDVWARTDGDGVLTIRRAHGLPFAAVSLDRRWLVEEELDEEAGTPQVTAHAAGGIEVRFVDAGTERPLEDGTLDAWARRADGVVASTSGPSLTWLFPIRAEGEKVDVWVESAGHRPKALSVPAAAPARPRTVALEPWGPGERGEIAIDPGIVGPDGRAVALRVERVVVPAEGLPERRQHLPTERRVDGASIALLPPGASTLLVHVNVPLAFLPPWRGTVSVPSGAGASLRVPWPPHGSLRVRPAARPGEQVAIRVERDGGESMLWDVGVAPVDGWILAPAVPVGRLRLSQRFPAMRPAVEAIVEAGQEAVVDLSR